MKISLFSSSVYIEEDVSWLDSLNKFSEKYINQAKEDNKKLFINNKDFGLIHHSIDLSNDSCFFKFMSFISKRAYEILDEQGYDLSLYSLVIRQLWVQEFSMEGGGYHSLHTHWDGHISGFYFLKCSDKTSYPIFHDPKVGKRMIQLPEKKDSLTSDASEQMFLKPKPGTFIFFNSYLAHEFPVDHGIDPFRFIHFNIQAFPKQLINNNIKHISS